MKESRYRSWGGYPRTQQEPHVLNWLSDNWPKQTNKSLLPFGNGRSYGDSCLNNQGILLDARGLDHFIDFDVDKGILRCEAGVLLSEILDLIVPKGWFLPVTPGTKYVTIGGAIANDVHGKNHHRNGTFGRFVKQFELQRSDGTRLICSPTENTAMFEATISGLGLTGLILWAEIELQKIHTPYMNVESIRFANLDEFFELSEESNDLYEYTVAWIDCLAKGNVLGRGFFMRANHAVEMPTSPPTAPSRKLSIPIELPFPLLNSYTLKTFNTLYYNKQFIRRWQGDQHYDPFFYPLDGINHWNRMYGKEGFVQYQCVVPHAHGKEVIRNILSEISRARSGSFLSVLKVFGDSPSPGMLSFPQPGVTLALDFPNKHKNTFELLDNLDILLKNAGGRLYPAKDARMTARNFKLFYPNWEKFSQYIDPRFSSSFWRRVTDE
ncbi:MAG: FAD-binding oxidoreductase [Gammaproteobacteria bacterium]|nr:FAD-binding oxidoreductase [Gammaproteobacteria bacterium]